jgi:hypothetical protein
MRLLPALTDMLPVYTNRAGALWRALFYLDARHKHPELGSKLLGGR